jgi:hypothetical protein
MSYKSEYNNSSVQGGSCAYTNLSTYNNGAQGMASAQAVSSASRTLVVPTFGSTPGYNTVSARGVPSCSGYTSLATAYNNNSGGCGSQYISRLCQQ